MKDPGTVPVQGPEPRRNGRSPERLPDGGRDTELSTVDRRRLTLAALRKPLNLLVLAVGLVFSLIALSVWPLLLTLLTYATLVFLAVRDPIFQNRVLGGAGGGRQPVVPQEADASPERRARWLPRGETRQRVEAALEVHRKVLSAIEDSDEVTRTVLGDAVPRLRGAADRLVDLAHLRERAAGAVRELESEVPGNRENLTETVSHEQQDLSAGLKDLRKKVRDADAEISGMVDQLLALRAKVVRASLETGGTASGAAASLNSDLQELNFRLEALQDTLAPKGSRPDR